MSLIIVVVVIFSLFQSIEASSVIYRATADAMSAIERIITELRYQKIRLEIFKYPAGIQGGAMCAFPLVERDAYDLMIDVERRIAMGSLKATKTVTAAAVTAVIHLPSCIASELLNC